MSFGNACWLDISDILSYCLYQTILDFYNRGKDGCKNHHGNRKKMQVSSIFSFSLHVFFPIVSIMELACADILNMKDSKICLVGKDLSFDVNLT